MKNSFFLVIPQQRKSAELSKNFQENALKQWVEELPTANPSLATRLFHDYIVEFNQLEMSPAQRLSALEILRPSYVIIEDYLRARLIQSHFPKSESDKKIMEILVAIEREFTLGYWIVARELTRKTVSWFQGKNTALALQRSIKGLSAIVVTYALMYRAVPDWIWIDLHSLFKLGESLNRHTIRVSAEFNNDIKTTSIEDSYRQILLFSVAQPARLLQKEILQLYLFLEPMGALLKLEDRPVVNVAIQCVLRTDDDKPPAYQTDSPSLQDKTVRYLNFEKFFKQLKNRDKYADSAVNRFSALGSNANKLSSDLLAQLETRWSGQELQPTIAFTDRMDRYIALGLESAFNFLDPNQASVEQEVEYKAQSASEISLSCDFNKTGVIAIGSLISYRRADSAEDKRILAIVSKMLSVKQDDKINFEVDIITPFYFPVSIEITEDKKKVLQKKALLYGLKEPGQEDKRFIILETFSLKDGDVVRMYMANEDYPIIVKDRKNIGLGYWQFECRRMQETEVNIPVKQGYDFI